MHTRHRGSTVKKHFSRTPSGKSSMVVRKGSVSEKLCAICHAKLAGMPNTRRNFKKLAKTEKRPERRFAGVLCGNCVAKLIREKTRMETGSLSREDIPLQHLKYIDVVKF